MSEEKRTQLAFDLVHGIDALEAERTKLTAKIDEQIRTARADLDTLLGGHLPRATSTPRVRKRGVGQQLCGLLASTPGADYGTLATQIYGSDSTDHRNKLRSLLMSLKRANLVSQVAPGEWTVTAEV